MVAVLNSSTSRGPWASAWTFVGAPCRTSSAKLQYGSNLRPVLSSAGASDKRIEQGGGRRTGKNGVERSRFSPSFLGGRQFYAARRIPPPPAVRPMIRR